MVLNNAPISSSFTSFPTLGDSDDLGPASRSRFDDLTTSSLHADDDIMAPEAILDGDAIEDLLASLGDNNIDHQISANSTGYFPVDHEGEDKHHTQELVSNAYGFIKQTTSPSIGADEGTDTSSHAVRLRRSKKKEDIPDFLRSDNEEDESSSDEEEDEAEAAKYVEDLLKDLQANPPKESPADHEEGASDENNDNSKGNRDEDNDDDLSNRLAALSLPSVPNDQPTSNRSAYNRKENESPECCCICYDNAKLKCMDCEGNQLFCVRCWWEMHGDLGGSEGHKAVKYEVSRM